LSREVRGVVMCRSRIVVGGLHFWKCLDHGQARGYWCKILGILENVGEVTEDVLRIRNSGWAFWDHLSNGEDHPEEYPG
jgi:hypothetical protein